MDSTVMDLARFLFERQARTYTQDADHIQEMWDRWEVRDFWIAEAEAIIDHLIHGGVTA